MWGDLTIVVDKYLRLRMCSPCFKPLGRLTKMFSPDLLSSTEITAEPVAPYERPALTKACAVGAETCHFLGSGRGLASDRFMQAVGGYFKLLSRTCDIIR